MNDIRECVIWMIPFALAIKDEGFDNPRFQMKADESPPYNTLQQHTVDLQLLVSTHFK